VEGQVIDFVRYVPLSNHMVLFYETSEKKYDIIFAFVKAGLENQQSVIYVTNDDDNEVVLSRLSQIGTKEVIKG